GHASRLFRSAIRPFAGAPTRLSRDYQHIVADFLGVPANQLADRALISGLVVAAASAAGMNASGIPTMLDRKAGGLTAALFYVDWIWPVVLVIFAAQAVYALARRVVNPAWGIPIAVYDVIIAAAGVVRYMASRGVEPAQPLLLLLTAHTAALSLATTQAAIAN